MKKIRQSFYMTFIGSLLFFAGTVYLYIMLFKLFPGNGLVFASLFLVLIVYMYLITYVQVKLEDIVMRKNNLLIQENQEPPKNIVKALNPATFLKYLADNGFELHVKQDSYSIFYGYDTDPVKKIFKHNLLQIVILIGEDQNEFYLDAVDDEIENIKSMLINDKVKVSTILISQYKAVTSITKKVKEQLLENILLKNKYGLYSVINIALDESSQKAVFLHSLNYNPSLYYQFHVQQILNSL